MSDLIALATGFSIGAHADQVRKYTGEPYWYHPRNVAYLVSLVSHNEHQIAAAWLHDVIEDTEKEENDICDLFGIEIAAIVMELTDTSKPEDGNREIRKAIDRERLRNSSILAQTIKIADLIDNTMSIVDHDLNFVKIYLKEKALLLEVLTKANPVLKALAHETLLLSYKKLGIK